MRIIHIAPNAPYNENWGYQENLLPKYQSKMGHDVVLIVSTKAHKDGKIIEVEESDYINADGIRVIRRKEKQYISKIFSALCAHIPVEKTLIELNPDFVFLHGLINTTVFDVIRYKRKIHPSCVIVQDNHLDYNISRGTRDIKGKFIRFFYRMIAKKTLPDISRVYGVTPWRAKFVQEYFKIPKEKTDVLIMGADDEKINLAQKQNIREKIREEYNVSVNDFLIVTGGKIDEAKKIHLLVEAVAGLEGVHLIVFGEATPTVREYMDKVKNDKTDIIGWISAEKTYDFFLASDLVCFPGQHSVLWEQACACKVPCLFGQWDGMDHVNNGGNSDFITKITTEEIRSKIEELKFTEKYYHMKKIAESEKTDIYLYSAIAKKSLEMSVEALR